LLGADAAAALRAELAARARRWAAATAPGRAFEATTLAAAEAALHDHAGPVLLASPDVPGLDERLTAAALSDLAAGCDVVLGAAHDALPYILAVPCMDHELLALVESTYRDGVLAAFAQRGIVLGLLRHERRLASAADARALAIDPLAPADLAALVLAGLAERGHR
jgi:glycosyltransferase A (GT-A) superfamily protein (DUF2064 family)